MHISYAVQVYIYGCVGATVTVNGKCKSINVDSCKKTKVVFDHAMASCEIVNSQRINVQVTRTKNSFVIYVITYKNRYSVPYSFFLG
jgi:hypothetical protein